MMGYGLEVEIDNVLAVEMALALAGAGESGA